MVQDIGLEDLSQMIGTGRRFVRWSGGVRTWWRVGFGLSVSVRWTSSALSAVQLAGQG